VLNSQDQHIYSVSQLNREARLLLEQQFGSIWLEGEISNLARPASGHWYLSLKDQQAQLRCAMFKNRNRTLRFAPQNGDQVLVRGVLGLYEARGDFQLIIDRMEPVGEGQLQRRFEQMRAKLLAEGLFDDAHKQPLPPYPQSIGVITSPTGAAIRDVLHVLRRRFPSAGVVVYPTAVQGDSAAPQLVEALRIASSRRETDVLLMVRGGGSLEDLWPFNEETVARAIHACTLPVVSGVGHETDLTLADLVADQRAPTPSAAAEVATPDGRELRDVVNGLANTLQQKTLRQVHQTQTRSQELHTRLLAQHPRQQLTQKSQRVDELESRLLSTCRRRLADEQQRIAFLQRRLQNASPQHHLPRLCDRIRDQLTRLSLHQHRDLEQRKNQLTLAMRTLHSASPLATLDRGYAILRHDDNRAVRSVSDVAPGDTLRATLHDGDIACQVDEISPSETAKSSRP